MPNLKVIAIGGLPCVGKSTLMWNVKKKLGAVEFKKFGLLAYEEYSKNKLIILGKYIEGETFVGTDKLPMNVQPTVCEFLRSYQNQSYTILFEGDRLFNKKLFYYIKSLGINLHILIIQIPQEIYLQNLKNRGSIHDMKFLKTSYTKVMNVKYDKTLPVKTISGKVEDVMGLLSRS